MSIGTIFWLIIVIIAIIIILKFMKGLLKIILSLSSLVAIIVVILGIFVFVDAADMKENLVIKDKLYLLEDDGDILTGVVIGKLVGGGISEEGITSLKTEEVVRISNDIKNNQYSSALGDNYKMFIIKKEVLGDLPETMEDMGEEAQAMAFLASLGKFTKENGQAALFGEYRNGNVYIYPETITFRIIKNGPDFLFEIIANRIFKQ